MVSQNCGDIIARSGDWITLTRKSDQGLVASFKATEDICKKMIERKIVFFYNEQIENINYFIVVSSHKNIKNIRFILTAFSINNQEFLKEKNIYFRYINK